MTTKKSYSPLCTCHFSHCAALTSQTPINIWYINTWVEIYSVIKQWALSRTKYNDACLD